MKQRVLILGSALIILALAAGIVVTKENTLREGSCVLLPLRPVDPRSLLQGDYMALAYQLEDDVKKLSLPPKGRLVVRLDDHDVASFVRIDNGTSLSDDERYLKFTNTGTPRVAPHSFFFEEGTGERYAGAKYGELRVDGDGNAILTHLRDKEFKRIVPETP
ncbi:GDYXXLXY domain-containing protein [Desulfovibrio inopinatus]|uniref:GDYXXLXY domain-containing protein n=1 Tax=Desulfovibrio inopinatus TaxID=102109 RepID=UPI0004014FF5|nr:GDYXXLXY domain-containing protein [Desulfovibrio inopinatus]